MEETYTDGKLTLRITYHSNGKKRSEEPHLQNMTHGVVTSYTEQGDLESETTFKLGKKTGPFTSYHANGEISIKGEYLKDKEIGIWLHYDKYWGPD